MSVCDVWNDDDDDNNTITTTTTTTATTTSNNNNNNNKLRSKCTAHDGTVLFGMFIIHNGVV